MGEHICSVCGEMHGHMHGGPMGKMHGMKGGYHKKKGMGGLVHKAKKKLLIEKLKAKLEQRHGAELDKLAEELIEFADAQTQAKVDNMKKAMEVRSHFWQVMHGAEPAEGEAEEEGEEGAAE